MWDENTDKRPYQLRVGSWMISCFGEKISHDRIERNFRFLEEALELVQSLECSKEDAHKLVDYVFDRKIGEPTQEVGGVMVTLAALCLANDIDMMKEGNVELERVWQKIDLIREKQKRKPHGSPLPGSIEEIPSGVVRTSETLVVNTGLVLTDETKPEILGQEKS